MDESLLPREMAVGGVGTLRVCCDIDVGGMRVTDAEKGAQYGEGMMGRGRKRKG